MKFAELEPHAKENALEQRAEWVSQDFDYSWVLDDAKTVMGHLGFSENEIYWSGFCSQGDGACFDGRWSAHDFQLRELLRYAPKDAELRRIGKELHQLVKVFKNASMHLDHIAQHYCHSNSVTITVTTHEDYADGSFENEFYASMSAGMDAETKFKQLTRDLMNWIYKQLEAEYNYQTSAESLADDAEFDEDGNTID